MNKLVKRIKNPFARHTEHETTINTIDIVLQLPTNLPDHSEDINTIRKPNLIFIWLDSSVNEIDNDDCQQTLFELKQVVNNLQIFATKDECHQYICTNPNQKIFLIVSGSLGQEFVPKIHTFRQVNEIYIFCQDKSKHEHWVKIWSKVRGVFTAILPICRELKQIVTSPDRNSISISIVSFETKSISAISTNQLDPSFMYTQILKETLFNIDFRKKSVRELTKYCQSLFSTNEKELKIINEFENKYHKTKSIWWYTRECFLHRILNQALRTMDIVIIAKMGFFVRDLHEQINELHRQQFQADMPMFVVYRGQGLSSKDFDKILKTKGGLLSFNNFLSTTENQNLAIGYACRNMNESGLMGVIFKISIHPSISSVPYARVKEYSYFKREEEILFCMHTIFRIENICQINQDSKEIWEIELILTNDSDQQLNELTQTMREETQGLKEWFSIGQLLIKLGQFTKAEEWYHVLLEQKIDNFDKGYIYHQLGWINDNLGHYTDSIVYYTKSLDNIEKHLHEHRLDLATCYDNIGSVCESIGDYYRALMYHTRALFIYQILLSPDNPDIATTLTNIGSVYNKMRKYDDAREKFQQALKIYQDKLPKNHPCLAVLYNNIGLLYNDIDDIPTALWYYDKALKIYQNTVPLNHPNFAIAYQNNGKALEKMGEYERARIEYEKALIIFQTIFPLDHPHLATCYSHIASVYRKTGDCSQALAYYEKSLNIREQMLPSHHQDLIISYNGIGDVYEQINDYNQAFLFYQKAFQICQTTPAPDNFLLTTSYHKMAKIYSAMGLYQEAHPYIQQAVDIAQRVLSLNNSDLEMYINTLKSIEAML